MILVHKVIVQPYYPFLAACLFLSVCLQTESNLKLERNSYMFWPMLEKLKSQEEPSVSLHGAETLTINTPIFLSLFPPPPPRWQASYQAPRKKPEQAALWLYPVALLAPTAYALATISAALQHAWEVHSL